MRKKFYFSWNVFLIIALTVALSSVVVSCGKDEPDKPDVPPETETPVPDEPSQPDEPSDPGEPEEPDNPSNQEPPEGDSSNYFTPTATDFLGAWRAYWVKKETYKCKNGKWSLSETEIYSDNIGTLQNWAKIIAFIDDDLNGKKLIWDYTASHYSTIIEAINNRDSWIMNYDIALENGVITGGNYYNWTWYPNVNEGVSMIVLNSGKTVQHRWKISQFDGDSFTSSPPFYDDFPSNKEGDLKNFYTYKYRRFTTTQ